MGVSLIHWTKKARFHVVRVASALLKPLVLPPTPSFGNKIGGRKKNENFSVNMRGNLPPLDITPWGTLFVPTYVH